MAITRRKHPPLGRCGDPGDDIAYSCTLNGAQYLTRTETKAATGAAKTWSVWVRWLDIAAADMCLMDGIVGSVSATWIMNYGSGAPSKLQYTDRNNTTLTFARAIRDVAGWYHLHLTYDGASTYTMQINGETIATSGSVPACYWGYVGYLYSLFKGYGAFGYFKGAAAEYIHIDGRAALSTELGYINRYGVWVPRQFAGQGAAAYGAQGWHLDFADPLNLGHDVSGNGNHWTPSGLTAASQSANTPTHGFPVLAYNDRYAANVSNGGRTMTANSGSGGCEMVTATTPIPPTGKWVLGEVVADTTNTSMSAGVRRGGARSRQGGAGSLGVSNWHLGECGYAFQGWIAKDGSTVQSGLATTAVGAALMVLYDADAGLLSWRNAAGQIGAAVSYAWTPGLVFAVSKTDTYGGATVNFGDRAFALAVPDGYKSMATNNLPCPPIKRPARYVTTRLRSASAGVTDLPWDATTIKTAVLSKSRNNATDWRLNLSTRAGRAIAINGSAGDFAEADGLTFTGTGYTIGAAAAYAGNRLDLIWRAARCAGFDILTIAHTTGTATTVAHNVGGAVDYAWVLNLSTGTIKRIYHRLGLAAGQYLALNTLDAAATDAGWFASTAVDLTLGAGLPTGTYAVLAWLGVLGFSDFGSHVGNSLADGPTDLMDFAPLFMVSKNANQGSNYHTLQDIARSPVNPVDLRLWLSDAASEISNGDGTCDFVSTGVKVRTSHFGLNGSGNTIIRAAWAACPGKFARAR
jgi:hypothetical protein